MADKPTQKSNLVKAVLAVMSSIDGIDKNLEVGTGKSTYNGIADSDVKRIIGKAMRENGLIILPIEIDENTVLTDKLNNYGKHSVLTKVKTKYLLMHESGESIELCGIGHGTDRGDKAAGKATTYALKYTLLYTFMIETKNIDDTDNTHSDDLDKKTKSLGNTEYIVY